MPRRVHRTAATGLGNAEVRALTALAFLLAELLLWWGFTSEIGPRYAYLGFAVRNIAPGSVLLAILLSLAPILVLPLRMDRPSAGILWLLYVLGVIPPCLFPFLVVGLPQATLFGFELLTLASFMAVVVLVSFGPAVWATADPRHRRRFRYAVAAAALVGLGLVIVQFGLPTSFVSLGDVYERRFAFRDETAAANPLFGYLVPWLQNVFAPILLVIAIVRRSLLYTALAVALEMWVYLTMGSRQALFGLPLVLLAYVVFTRFRTVLAGVVASGLLVIVVVSLGVDGLGASPWFVALGLYRALALPGIVAGQYFEMFLGAPKVYGRDGVLGVLGSSPYPLPVPRLIGEHYWGSAQINANANMWADGFANFGILGFVVVAAVLITVLWLLDSRVRSTEAGAVAASAALFSVGLANVGVQTALLTGGLFPFVALIWLSRGALFERSGDRPLGQRRRARSRPWYKPSKTVASDPQL